MATMAWMAWAFRLALRLLLLSIFLGSTLRLLAFACLHWAAIDDEAYYYRGSDVWVYVMGWMWVSFAAGAVLPGVASQTRGIIRRLYYEK